MVDVEVKGPILKMGVLTIVLTSILKNGVVSLVFGEIRRAPVSLGLSP